jgi:hypothetical protein
MSLSDSYLLGVPAAWHAKVYVERIRATTEYKDTIQGELKYHMSQLVT